jgi:hypothetical protein
MLEEGLAVSLQRQRIGDVSFEQSTAIAPWVHGQLTSCHLRVFGNEDKVKKCSGSSSWLLIISMKTTAP